MCTNFYIPTYVLPCLSQNQVLKTEKEKEEQRHEEEIGETGEKHAKELQDLESNNNQKLMLEYEKYQELQVCFN